MPAKTTPADFGPWASAIEDFTIHLVAPDQLLAAPLNARRHPGVQRDALRASLAALGWIAPLLVNTVTGHVIDGHERVEEALSAGAPHVPIVYVSLTPEQESLALATYDPISAMATYDAEVLDALSAAVNEGYTDLDPSLANLLTDLDAHYPGSGGNGEHWLNDPERNNTTPGALVAAWGAPPLTVLDTRSGHWQERKRWWREVYGLGNDGEGRDSGLTYAGVFEAAGGYTTSRFDPALAEIVYRWHLPDPPGQVLDPFCGGPTRGLVAQALGHRYVGNDLRPEQTKANRAALGALPAKPPGPKPNWRVGDAADATWPAGDLLFTCPPYWHIEQYSDDPLDLSNAPTLDSFLAMLTACFHPACEALRPDSFAVVVMANARDKRTGALADLPGLTMDALVACGLVPHARYVLVSPVYTYALTAGRNFANRRPTPCHQEVVVAVKGDADAAAARLGDASEAVTFPEGRWIDPDDPEAEAAEDDG